MTCQQQINRVFASYASFTSLSCVGQIEVSASPPLYSYAGLNSFKKIMLFSSCSLMSRDDVGDTGLHGPIIFHVSTLDTTLGGQRPFPPGRSTNCSGAKMWFQPEETFHSVTHAPY